MSMVTTCPACGTSFRVKPQQLSAHSGDVRCGKCDHVFHALDSLAKVSEDSAQSTDPKFTVLEEAGTGKTGTADLFDLPETAPDVTEHIVYPGRLRSRELERQAILGSTNNCYDQAIRCHVFLPHYESVG